MRATALPGVARMAGSYGIAAVRVCNHSAASRL